MESCVGCQLAGLPLTSPAVATSILDPTGDIWITPSRVDKGRLQPSDIVCVHPDGKRTGFHPPSSEFPFHREIYRRRSDIKAIVHAHPGAGGLLHLSQTSRYAGADRRPCGLRQGGLRACACPGSKELGENIAETFAAGSACVMLENHGVVIGGSDLHDAFQRFETLEFIARTLVKAAALGEIKTLAPAELPERSFSAARSARSYPCPIPPSPNRARSSVSTEPQPCSS